MGQAWSSANIMSVNLQKNLPLWSSACKWQTLFSKDSRVLYTVLVLIFCWFNTDFWQRYQLWDFFFIKSVQLYADFCQVFKIIVLRPRHDCYINMWYISWNTSHSSRFVGLNFCEKNVKKCYLWFYTHDEVISIITNNGGVFIITLCNKKFAHKHGASITCCLDVFFISIFINYNDVFFIVLYFSRIERSFLPKFYK